MTSNLSKAHETRHSL